MVPSIKRSLAIVTPSEPAVVTIVNSGLLPADPNLHPSPAQLYKYPKPAPSSSQPMETLKLPSWVIKYSGSPDVTLEGLFIINLSAFSNLSW